MSANDGNLDLEPLTTRRTRGRPPLLETLTDPKGPVDLRFSKRKRLRALSRQLSIQTQGRFTLDDTVGFLLDFHENAQSRNIL